MSKKQGFRKFLFGTLIGAGLGVLFAPRKGSETRKQLKAKLNDLIAKAKETDVEELRTNLEAKIEEIRIELEELDKEKVLKMAKKKAAELKEKTEDLVQVVIDKGTPILQKLAEDVREKVIEASKEIIANLEKKGKTEKEDE